MLIILVVIYYIFLRYSPEKIITYSGYAIEGKEMVENLKSSDKSKQAPYLGLIAVQENDLLYKRLNTYYVGEDDKKEIDINYPIYINEGNALLNLGENTKLITVNYEEVEGYPDFMMADGVMYNGADITRADGNKYLFLKSEDGIYTNVEPITVTTANGEYTIKEFSNIYFAEDYIAYYEMEGMQEENQGNNKSDNLKDSYLAYKEISPIDPDSKTKLNGETITYKTLLERLEILQTEESGKEISNEVENTIENEINTEEKEKTEENKENTVTEETTEYNNIVTNQTIINMENNNNEEDEWQEGMWEKPEVSCTDFETGVYSATTNLSVRDRAGVISRGVMFELYLDGRLNRRVLATQTGNIEISNLQPSSEYEIKGIFYYKDENGIEMQEEFYNGTATTKSIDTLGTIDFSFQNGEIYSNKIELKNLKINNNIDEEVIKGISRLQVEIGDIAYRLSNNQVNDIKAGKEITYQTSESLTSNSKIKYKITAFDRFGNELKEQNNEGETITSKQIPTASIRPTKQDVTEIEIEVVLNNKDNVKLENYRYEITNQSGDIVKRGTLNNKDVIPNDGTKETLKFNDLDPNGYYQMVIYGDYDLEDGTGIKENAELGRGSFVTRPLASLGYMQVKIDDKEITQNSMNLGISIDENQTDARLLAILDKVEVVIYDQGKNVENIGNGESNGENTGGNGNNGDNSNEDENNENESNSSNSNNSTNNLGQPQTNQEETEVQRITFTQEQVEQLKVAEEVELNIERLNSNTKYRINVITTVKQGTVEEVVEDKQNLEQLITLKMPAEVQIKNQFVIGTMIDLDMRIEDIDNAVLTNEVRIEVRDKDNKLIDLSEMKTNAEYERKTYEDLTPNEEYRIIVYAPQYNIGSTDETYEADYVLKEIKIVTETGISGRLDLIGLEKTPTGKNLIDISSKVNWYEKCFNTSYKYGLSYNEETKILTLGGSGVYNNRNYYDLSKYLGREITISFKARNQSNTNLVIAEKSNSDFKDTNYTTYYTINDFSNEWQEYKYTVKLSKTGYIGLLVQTENASVEIQDLQIELGNRKTDYEEFKYDYNANVTVTVNDERNEITTNDYYIRIYKNNEQIQELRYEEIGEDNKVENIEKTYNVEPDANYKIELLVKIGERYYELDSQEFSTEGSREIKGIFDKNDFLKIQPNGEYIVLNDLDLSGGAGSIYRFGSVNMQFNGKLNFNGNSLTRDLLDTSDTIIYRMSQSAIVENLEFNIKMNNEVDKNMNSGFVFRNDGTIRNIQINLTECNKKSNFDEFLLMYDNYGVLENFILNFKVPLYIHRDGSLMYRNYGIIRNGYLCGENMIITNGQETYTFSAGIAIVNGGNGVLENVYSLVNIDSQYMRYKGTLIYGNNENSTVQNVYSVGMGENAQLNYGPNIYSKTSKKIYNNYYFADEIFTGELETKGNKLSLWDATFQNQLINNDGAFIVDDLVNEGYFPQLRMPDCMPVQEYIELPEVVDSDLPDILSTKVLEQGTNIVKVEFSVNNPSSEQINTIEIANLEVEILSQEYKEGKSTVIAELKNPDICVSSYDVISISTKGAFGTEFTRPYEKGERVINVDLYKEIWNVSDWKAINDSPIENYIIMSDLDFVNEGNSISIENINGILNGNSHTISNIKIDNVHFIKNVYGTVKDLYINNFNQKTSGVGGLISNLLTSSIVDNVHMTNVVIDKNGSGGSGGIASVGNLTTIRNCSVNNIKISVNGAQNEVYIGGVVGNISNSIVENCYVKGIDAIDDKGVSSGIGGIVGNGGGTNNIINCYTEGKIVSDNINVGGIIGKSITSNIQKSNIENCFSKVDISTTNSNVGGIVGIYSDTDFSGITNNLSIGNIYTTSGIINLNRILGNNSETSSSNYAYENQLLNGYASKEAKGATILSKDEVMNLNLGDGYNYDKKNEGILPKLYNTEGTELLPNQSDIFLNNTNDEETANIRVETIEATKPNSTEAEITIRIINPEKIEITGIEIEDMQVVAITRNVTQNGVTSITAKALPTRYYDSYRLIGIEYKTTLSEEKTIEVENEIAVQFYKEIYTFEDWQLIEEGTYQNYRLMSDIDFSGKTNVKNNITVNRLEAENKIYTLKNIELTYNSTNTGFINNVKTSIKNIGFENITLTNTTGAGTYFGIIASNDGNVKNLKFTNITVNARGINYVGMVGSMTTGGNIRNVDLKDITISGGAYLGGVVGNINISLEMIINNIVGDNITIVGTENYVGGLIGSLNGSATTASNLVVKNSNIQGANYTGGIVGYAFQNVFRYIETINTDINGSYYIGALIGYGHATSSASEFITYAYVNLCEVTGISYVGGLLGQIQYGLIRYSMVDSTNVQTTSAYTGGAIGGMSASYLQYFSMSNVNVESTGGQVGGAVGGNYEKASISIEVGYLDNIEVTGGFDVGGVLGLSKWSWLANLYVKGNVNATLNTAGGAIGYMDNAYMAGASDITSIKTTTILDSNVSAPSKAGGLVGSMAKEIYRNSSFYYNNYIEADVTCINVSTGSLIIGGRPDENDYIDNTYVYKYSKINGNYVYATNDNIEDNQYLVRTDLNSQSTYSSKIGIGTTYWNYASLSEGKYPKIKDAYLYKPELQTGVNLPVDPEIADISLLSEDNESEDNEKNDLKVQSSIVTEKTEALPNYTVYPVSVNEINVDFSEVGNNYKIDENNGQQKEQSSSTGTKTYFTYFINGQEKETVELSNSTKQTYTFKYNIKDTLEIKLARENNIDFNNVEKNNQTNSISDGSVTTKTNTRTNVETGKETKIHTETIVITPEDVRSEASLVGGNNAYLLGTNLYINGELQQGEYVNVYEGKALNSSGQVVDIATKQMIQSENTDARVNVDNISEYNEDDNNNEKISTQETTYLEQTAKPLHTYEYKGNTLEVYGTYSKINDNIKTQIYNVRNGKLSALSNSLDMKIGNSITDNYNNKEYQTILNTSGELVNLKEMLKYPDNFLTRNIKQIVQNKDEEKTEVMVLYNTGKVIVFNYVSGEVVYENNEKADERLTDYITGSIENIWNDYEEKREEYAKSKELEQKLTELPIAKAMEQVNRAGQNYKDQNENENSLSANSSSLDVSDNTNNNENSNNSYITVYNAGTGKYEIYSENEILNSNSETPVSETEKITQNGLEEIYGYNAKEETKPQTNGAIIVIAIITVAVIALVILRKIVVKNNIKRKKL